MRTDERKPREAQRVGRKAARAEIAREVPAFLIRLVGAERCRQIPNPVTLHRWCE